MIKNKALLIFSVSTTLFCINSFAEESAETNKWDGWLSGEGAYADGSSFGDFNSFIPLTQDDSGLSYLNILAEADEDFAEGQAGYGYRQIINDDWAVGGYGFLGKKRTEFNNDFYQLNFGAEIISFDWDFRFNFYIPIGDKEKEVSRNATTNQIRKEFAYHGADLEVGYRLPIWDEADDSQMRIYGGSYYFDADGAEHIAGGRVRLEYDIANIVSSIPGSSITLGAEYQHDNVNKETNVLTAAFTVPFDFFRSNKQSQYNSLSPLEKRINRIRSRRVNVTTHVETDPLTTAEPAPPVVIPPPPPPLPDGDGIGE
ncbi:inverse autotransporter beta domain-containing protein [Endozoicomonas sp. SM1973]|uniref:Inverse autotransporter beta domain-containing protein n=1 Tax=Spartinivicinus marinus TaxID=2994442 RepID=A0A853IE49_9GAMM|nr:inverse autotransporter beta domain-containing protein [Spartinivicinus marinus]MCX4028432.1 inverse autotransporter beta domain-containing protein [Spartinivicinus marinus]NYZ67455.1 inverse autotransporter beta domain-containing protein [Spartinivicinus marinus]